MNITETALEKLGVKREKFDDETDNSVMNYEYKITTKSNLEILVEIRKKNEGGKWVETDRSCYLDNGQNLYRAKGCETLQDLYQLLRILGSASVDLDLFEDLILRA